MRLINLSTGKHDLIRFSLASLVTAIVFHQLFEGLSLGIRIAGLPAPDPSAPHQMSLLKPILASLFAVTTPVGILIGLASFGVGSSSEEGAFCLPDSKIRNCTLN